MKTPFLKLPGGAPLGPRALTLIPFALFGAAVGYAYGYSLWHLGVGLAGAGHGTPLFAMVAFGPGGLFLYLFALIGFLAGFRTYEFARFAGRCVLIVYYVCVMPYIVSSLRDSDSILRVLSGAPLQVALVLGLYVTGQVLIARCFLSNQRLRHPEPPEDT
jgi:hypothetical protein